MKTATGKIFTLFKQGFFYSAGNLINKFLMFLMIPLYAEFILPEDLSLLAILDPAEQLVFGILSLGFVHAFFRYFTKQESEAYREKVVSTIFWFITFIAIAVCAVLLLFSATITDLLLPVNVLAKTCFILTVVSLFVRFYNLLGAGILHINQKAYIFSIWDIIGTAIFCVYNFYFLAFQDGTVENVFEARIFLMIPVNIVGFWYLSQYLSFTFDWKVFKEMFAFSYPFILSAAAYPILNYVDRYMLSEIAGAGATGIYDMSYRFGMIPGMLLVNPFLKAWRPFIFNYDDRETQEIVYQRILLYYTFIGCLLWLGLSVYREEVIVLFTSEAYYEGYVVIPYVASSQLLYGMGWIVIAGLAVKEKTFFIGFCTFLAGILNALLNYWWIPVYGMLGAAYATLAAFLAIFAGYAIYSYLQLPLKWPFLRLLVMVITVIAIYNFTLYLPEASFWTGIFYKALCIIPCIFILAYAAGINLLKLNSIAGLLNDKRNKDETDT